MLYLFCIIFPPLAVLMVGKPIQALINLFLTMLFWFPGMIHAFFVVNDKKADNRMKKQAKMMKS